MKNSLALAVLLLITSYLHAGIQPVGEAQGDRALSFTENKGQVHDQNYHNRPDVLFSVVSGKMAAHIRSTGVSYQLYRTDEINETIDPISGEKRKDIQSQTIQRIDLNWINCNKNPEAAGEKPLPGFKNYYKANCPDGVLNVKSYGGLFINDLYQGIDLHYYEKNGELKHDYIVAAGANYRQIQILVNGADATIKEDGSLLLSTPMGSIHEGAPLVFQHGRSLRAKWVVKENKLSFLVLDKVDHFAELIIDPVTRLWGTYFGLSGEERGRACATDNAGNVYFSGESDPGTGAPLVTSGAHQVTFGGGPRDAYLAKFNNSGTKTWCTYYGGTSGDGFNICTVDISGNVYAAGYSGSSTGIASSGHQMIYNGGSDAILVKFSSSGVRLWGTYYGSGGSDIAYGCTTDANGDVFMCGSTSGATGTVIVSPGAHQTLYGGGNTDGFLVKFSGSGVRQWGTFYGGPTSYDNLTTCVIDGAGNVYVAGDAGSATGTIIATASSHQPSYGGGTYDALLAKFNTNGIRQWATWYGGTAADHGWSCAIDTNGDILFSGNSASSGANIIASPGSHQVAFGGGLADGFLAKFSAAGVRVWGSYYGGSDLDNAACVRADAAGNIYITGFTASSSGTNIATAINHQPNYGGGIYDGFLAKFDNNGIRNWGTYYGGAGEDWSYLCAPDQYGSVFIAGFSESNSGTIIATPNSYQAVHGGGTDDAFLARFDACDLAPLQPVVINGPLTICSGVATSYSVQLSLGATSYSWSVPAGWSGSSNTNVFPATAGSTGVISVVAGNACGVSTAQTLNVSVNASPIISVNSGSICKGQTFTLAGSGATNYTYSAGAVVSPTTTTSYSVTGSSAAGCISSNTAIATVNVNQLPNITVSTSTGLLCAGEQATLTAGGAVNYTFNPGGTGASLAVSPLVTTSYAVTGTDANGCSNTSVISQSVDACTGIQEKNISKPINIFPNPAVKILYIQMEDSNQVEIVSAAGLPVFSDQLTAGTQGLNIESLAPGLYIIKIHQGSDHAFFKFVKQ